MTPTLTIEELRQLPTLHARSIKLTKRGLDQYAICMHRHSLSGDLPGDRLRKLYGSNDAIPAPTVAIEPDDTTLVLFWDIPGEAPAVIRLDGKAWEFQ